MTASGKTENSKLAQVLTETQVQQFISDGFVKVEHAFSRELANEARTVFWKDLRAYGCVPDDPDTWTYPVIRLGMYDQKPVVAAANTTALRAAFDQLAGQGCWLPCRSVGTLPVRFPSPDDPGDTGWHVDASFDYEKSDFMDWRVNIRSRGRALLMLFLFTDVGEEDAPTRLRAGSHKDIARALVPAGEAGLSLRELIPHIADTSARPEVIATGSAGTVYLCHPFLVHSAQMHRGSEPRFLAQPPLLPRSEPWLGSLEQSNVPVARAISLALEEGM
ncbi:MAG TPA: phytanoyl-CoA dioxygenase family protein [Pusillimonas sp.]|uniref:phytanoyl-CoA dioxygenase family protein n=1 Tax=unclassified Pusillimonas TaxID=2640016 RepID=UPI00261098B7|nr:MULTISPECIES: phytanoyl-CoA dioxygenase family protein [unclassified Pusillimonas]HLU18420.1 phytanoyl-CoA dioxygenase family protein [Pusillimonas sp.]